jgi:hypothetical protein
VETESREVQGEAKERILDSIDIVYVAKEEVHYRLYAASCIL